jgi:hypothetical protein
VPQKSGMASGYLQFVPPTIVLVHERPRRLPELQHTNSDCNIDYWWQNAVMDKRRDNLEIACQQVLVEDSSVFSVQWSTFPSKIAAGLTPRSLLERYLAYLCRTTLSIIRPTESATGVEFRLLGSRWSLISFLPPEMGRESVTLRICGGLLVQSHQCDRGELRFTVEPVPEGVKVTLQLSDYCPLILGSSVPSPVRRWLYRLTQAAIHRLVTIRFLMLLYRDLAGLSAPVQVVNVNVRAGRPL